MIFGVDPSLTGTGISNGEFHDKLSTKSDDTQTPEENAYRRTREIMSKMTFFCHKHMDMSGEYVFYVEAPLLRAVKHGGSHLYEMGWWMCHMRMWFRHARIVVVNIKAVRAYICGDGAADIKKLRREVQENWGVTFERDAKGDRLIAYCLWRYGCAVERGEIRHTPIHSRRAPKRRANATSKVRDGEASGIAC